MAILETKYNLGDIVFSPSTENTPYWEKCTSCDGTGSWKVEGRDIKVNCTKCGDAYRKGNGRIQKFTYQPRVDILTVGQIRIEHDLTQHKVQYMCEETGIGSGTLHYEKTLFQTKDEALVVAQGMANKSNETGWHVYVSDYLQ